MDTPHTSLRSYFDPVRVGRDLGFVLPGFFLSLPAFIILVPLTALSAGTIVIWIGALLFAVALSVASAFAQVSRARLHWWTGTPGAPVRYRAAAPGRARWITGRLADGRRWLDLLFETLIAFPLHIFTFVVAVSWLGGAAGGLSYFIWGFFLPHEDSTLPGYLLQAASQGTVPVSVAHSHAIDVVFSEVAGLVLLLTLPIVLRGLANLDALVMRMGLEGVVAGPAVPTKPAEQASAVLPANTAFTLPGPEAWTWIFAGLGAVACLAIGWPLYAVIDGLDPVYAMLVAAGQAVALLCCARLPALVPVLSTVTALALAWLSADQQGAPWPWPVFALIVQSLLLVLVGLRGRWWRATLTWAVPLLGTAVLVRTLDWTTGAQINLIVAVSVTAAANAIGLAVRTWLNGREKLRAEREAAARTSAEREELAERNRIARELHDVVAHSMSVIGVQATTAPYRLPGLEEPVRREFASIAESARTALTEMRGLLTILRAGEAPTAPQPTLGDVPELVEATRRSGVDITLHGPGGEAARALPAATSLTAYRIVQEGLSNAVRHSPGAAITVTVSCGELLTIDVVNGPAAPLAESVPAPGAGLGLRGIRERVTALGGLMHAEPDAAGGFALHAELPV
ncbi:sensor domain-containing protein [Brevibacterium sp. 50QC2O2]|uniref:sensor histidine kinase n=1 Tax=unclassified Brevibacterium TaxID=2614124 RepID=UPI00211CAC78|nr:MULTISPECIES: sensor histidine kinase [unclassified Brevibacterium]MCQ9367176.1 sensor domain-containing protein [Brevibacterium sp. 91QC2O2]MCQ9388118.1 sensor domain-containing protein [Brevibacterium sp. 50QC2O2]